jgi:hypothetical protein
LTVTSGYESNQKWYAEMVDACMATADVTCGIKSSTDNYKYTLGRLLGECCMDAFLR